MTSVTQCHVTRDNLTFGFSLWAWLLTRMRGLTSVWRGHVTDADVVKTLGGAHPPPHQSGGGGLCSSGLEISFRKMDCSLILSLSPELQLYLSFCKLSFLVFLSYHFLVLVPTSFPWFVPLDISSQQTCPVLVLTIPPEIPEKDKHCKVHLFVTTQPLTFSSRPLTLTRSVFISMISWVTRCEGRVPGLSTGSGDIEYLRHWDFLSNLSNLHDMN